MSAASKTQPGGYAMDDVELEQFEISDERSAASVAGYDSCVRGSTQYGVIGIRRIQVNHSMECFT